MTEQEQKIADLQRLCERAYLILSENWSAYTDKDGYGPSSLLGDLQKVMRGKEYRDMRSMNRELEKLCHEQDIRIKELVKQWDDFRNGNWATQTLTGEQNER